MTNPKGGKSVARTPKTGESQSNGRGRERVRMEMNLLEYPLFTINSKSQEKELSIERVISNGSSTRIVKWLCTTDTVLPDAFDKKIFFALIQLYEAQDCPEDGEVTFSRYDLAEIMGLDQSGKTYRRLEEGLGRLQDMKVRGWNAWYETETGKFKDVLDRFSVISRVTLVTKGTVDQLDLVKSRAFLDPVLCRSIRQGYVKLMDIDTAMEIKSPIALRLFEVLSRRRNKKDALPLHLAKLAATIPLRSTASWRQLQDLERPHEELRRLGVIEAVTREEGGEGVMLVYRFKSGETVSVPAEEIQSAVATAESDGGLADFGDGQPRSLIDYAHLLTAEIAVRSELSAVERMTLNITVTKKLELSGLELSHGAELVEKAKALFPSLRNESKAMIDALDGMIAAIRARLR